MTVDGSEFECFLSNTVEHVLFLFESFLGHDEIDVKDLILAVLQMVYFVVVFCLSIGTEPFPRQKVEVYLDFTSQVLNQLYTLDSFHITYIGK